MAAAKLYTTDFEVFGNVQGVFFRKYTEKEAKKIGVNGWCMNTVEATVRGQIEGTANQIEEMKHWLQMKGSPKSCIDGARFSPLKEIPSFNFKSFTIRR